MGLPIMLFLVLFAAVLVNIPMGMWRLKVVKYSWKWFLAIHISIPLIYLMRTEANISYFYIPVIVIAALIGQLLGGKLFMYRERYKLKKGTA